MSAEEGAISTGNTTAENNPLADIMHIWFLFVSIRAHR